MPLIQQRFDQTAINIKAWISNNTPHGTIVVISHLCFETELTYVSVS